MTELPRVVVYRELFKAHAQFDVNPEDARRGRMRACHIRKLYVYKHKLMCDCHKLTYNDVFN